MAFGTKRKSGGASKRAHRMEGDAPKTDQARKKAIDTAIDIIHKKHGNSSIRRLGDKWSEDVQVISTVEGVDFVFFQGLVAIAGGMTPWTVTLRTSSSALIKTATQVAKRRLSNEQMLELRRNIQAQLDASALRIRSGHFEQAIDRYRHCGTHCTNQT